MKGVALSPILAVAIVLIGIVYAVYVFQADSLVSHGITKEGEVKKTIINMDKKIAAIPGVARDVILDNQHRFLADDDIELRINEKLKSTLGITANTTITGGDWEKTYIHVFIPRYETRVGDTVVSISNYSIDYELDAPRPDKLYEIYMGFDPSELCSHIEDNSGDDCHECPCGPNCTTTYCTYYRRIDITGFENDEHKKYNMKRVQIDAVNVYPTKCYDSTECGGGCGCSCHIGTVYYSIRIYDPKNRFVNFDLINRNGGDRFTCYD